MGSAYVCVCVWGVGVCSRGRESGAMAMRSSASSLSLLAVRAVGAALRPLQSTALYSTSSDSQPTNDNDYLLGTLPETMKAAVFWEPRKPMTIEELKMPRPQFGEVLIRTKGAIPHLLEPHYSDTIARIGESLCFQGQCT